MTLVWSQSRGLLSMTLVRSQSKGLLSMTQERLQPVWEDCSIRPNPVNGDLRMAEVPAGVLSTGQHREINKPVSGAT